MNNGIVIMIRVGLMVLLSTLIWQGLPQRLDVTVGQTATVYPSKAGTIAVTVTLFPQGNDNGAVILEIRSHEQLVGTIESHYNYDFFADQPAGWLRRTWVDGDWQRDLLIVTAGRPGYAYVSSQDGKLYWVTREE